MRTDDYIKGSSTKSSGSLVWDFFRVFIPIGLMILGLFWSAQLFAKMMNYDSRVVGNPTLIMEKEIYSIFVYLAACIKYSVNESASTYIIDSLYPMFVCTIAGLVFVFVWGIIRMMHSSRRNMHGTARFATKKDLKLNGLLAKEGGVILAQLDTAKVRADKMKDTALHLKLKKQAQFIQHSGKANTLLLAPTGSGKGVSVLLPTLLSYKGSMVVFDPKGENYSITAGYRSTFSSIIKFAPCSNFTARFNPVMAIRDSDEADAFRDANLIASIIFPEKKGGGGDGNAEHFNNLAKSMVTTAILHVRFCEKIKDKSLEGVRKFLSTTDYNTLKQTKLNKEQQEEEGQGDEIFLGILDSKYHYYPISYKDETTGKLYKQEVIYKDEKTGKIFFSQNVNNDYIEIKLKKIRERKEATVLNELIKNGAAQMLNIHAKEKSSVFTTVTAHMDLFKDPLLAQATSGNDFEIDDFIHSDKPITLYLTVPYSDVTRIAPAFRILISFMLKKFSEGETQHGSVRLKNHLLFLLDEFPILGYFPDIAQNMGVLRGYEVNFLIVCQALSQLIDNYGQNHPFLDHCVTQVIFAPGSTKDAEEFSSAIGNETFSELKVSSSGRRFSSSSNFNFNDNTAGRRLLDVSDLKRLSGDKCLVLAHGMQPYIATKCVYYEDSRFKKKLKLRAPENFEELYRELQELPSVQVRMKEYAKKQKEEKEREERKKKPDNFDEVYIRNPEEVEGYFDDDDLGNLAGNLEELECENGFSLSIEAAKQDEDDNSETKGYL